MTIGIRDTGIVVTGAFGALGAVTAVAAARAGAKVALIGRAKQVPAGLLEACGPGAIALPGTNLVNADEAMTAIAAARGALGSIDALINIAGAFRWQTVADGDPAAWDLLFNINLKTALNTSRAAIPHLRHSKHGRIINVGADAALKAGAGMGAYAASKSGVHRLTESLAQELKNESITVNAVLPSIIDTPANRADMPKADYSTWVTPDALSAVILFLADPASQAVSGALIPVRGRV